MLHRRAFTLIELIAVLVILSVIGGIATTRFWDFSTKAKVSAESATVGAVRASLGQYRINAAFSSATPWPATLDSVGINQPATSQNQLFTNVLQEPVTSGWSTGSAALTYVSPAGNVFVYDPTAGTFLPTGATSSGAGGSTSSGPAIANGYTNAATWTATAGTPISGFVGSGYTVGANGEILLSDSTPYFAQESRRVALAGAQAIVAGTYTLSLDTALTNYDNQLNYWEVIGVKNGTTLNLSGNTLNWSTNMPGSQILFQDYAPPDKSNGSYYTYSNTFTVSAADAANYDQIVVMLAGSRFSDQMLGWKNVSLTPP